MTTTNKLTAKRANEIQAEWMAVDSNGPKAEIDRVCNLMKELPGDYLSIGKTGAVPMIQGQPLVAAPMTIEECRRYYPQVQSILAWYFDEDKGHFEWVNICPICEGMHPIGCCAQDGKD